MESKLSFETSMEFAYGEPRELVPGIVRVVANNPGPFTFKGTNTYLVGSDELAVVDPGPGDPAHLDAVLQAARGRPVTHIFLTHTHRDHSDGLARLRQATGATVLGRGRLARSPGALVKSPSGSEFVDADFRPDVVLADGDRIAGRDFAFEVVATPGHAPDHLCFADAGRRVLFSGDHVMGWNTSVVAPPEGSMADYMSSLERLLGRAEERFLPGHGGQIRQPGRVVKAYIVHRRWREQAILDAIRAGHSTIERIVATVYSGIEASLLNAAALSVLAHVEHLIARGLVRCEGPPTLDRTLSAV